MHKAYALIFSTYCNKTMQNRIEEHPDFESTIRDDPIELLEKIKVLMHDPIRAKYSSYASLTEALIRLMNIKQFEQEQLLDYIKRFKQFRVITKYILDKFVENTREYREESGTENKKVMKVEAFNKWMAYLLIRNSDQAKYGSLMNGLVSQFSMENNQYPKTVTAATDILSNHRHDNWGVSSQRNKSWQKANTIEETQSQVKTDSDERSFTQSNKDKQNMLLLRKEGTLKS
jgi:hypothetical protein